MKIFPLCCSALIFTGCAHLPKVSLPGITAQGPKDNGTPVVVGKSDSGVSLTLPAGSKVVKREIKGLAFKPATKDSPAQQATPDETITEIIPGGPTEYHETKQDIKASSGTVDTTLAEKKLEAQENRVLLYGALGMLIAAGVFFWLHYPSPALMCAGGSVILFLAWKLSGLPDWFWVVAVLAGGGAAGLYFGHERGLTTSNKVTPTP